jgi:hypothetical protein
MTSTMRDQQKFDADYKALEPRMKERADADGDVFLPNPQPEGPVDYVLVCMEPSMGHGGDGLKHTGRVLKSGLPTNGPYVEAKEIIVSFGIIQTATVAIPPRVSGRHRD